MCNAFMNVNVDLYLSLLFFLFFLLWVCRSGRAGDSTMKDGAEASDIMADLGRIQSKKKAPKKQGKGEDQDQDAEDDEE